MRILVTGQHGFIGSVLTTLALAAGFSVAGLDADLFEPCVFGAEAPSKRKVRAKRRDLRDVGPRELEGFDAVVHLAALSNDPLGNLDSALTYDINLGGSLRLAHAAREAGVERFVFSSSCSNYGASEGPPLDEQAPLRPLTPYAISKVRVEEDLLRMADDSFSPVLLRNATAYGLSPRLRVDLVVNNLAAWAVTTGEIVLQSDGTPWRPLVHVEDIARAFLLMLEAPRETVHAQAFNVVPPGENYRVREIAELVSAAAGGAPVVLGPGSGPDARDYRVSGEKLATTFPDFRFRWSVESGARQVVDAFRASGLGRDELLGARYQRLAWIRALLDSGALAPDLRWRSEPALATSTA